MSLLDDLTTLLIVVAGFLLVIVALALPRLLRRQSAGAGGPLAASRPDTRSPELHSLEQIEKSMIQLEETAREVFGRIDTRSRVLIRLVEHAEVCAQRLEQAVEKGEGA